ncbi:MAG TPA: hypothetical protein VFP54_00470 [Acidimicrobiales bacterium]|nr:hypothetical protein [Acidimicrobiales bacterium]
MSWVSLLWRKPNILSEAVVVGSSGGAILFVIIACAVGRGWEQAITWAAPLGGVWTALGIAEVLLRRHRLDSRFARTVPVGLLAMAASVVVVILALLHHGGRDNFAR